MTVSNLKMISGKHDYRPLLFFFSAESQPSQSFSRPPPLRDQIVLPKMPANLYTCSPSSGSSLHLLCPLHHLIHSAKRLSVLKWLNQQMNMLRFLRIACVVQNTATAFYVILYFVCTDTVLVHGTHRKTTHNAVIFFSNYIFIS